LLGQSPPFLSFGFSLQPLLTHLLHQLLAPALLFHLLDFLTLVPPEAAVDESLIADEILVVDQGLDASLSCHRRNVVGKPRQDGVARLESRLGSALNTLTAWGEREPFDCYVCISARIKLEPTTQRIRYIDAGSNRRLYRSLSIRV
jgi:hypothetical protein